MTNKRVTMNDIATISGVSQSAVSMILNQKNLDSFPQATILRVQKAAQEANYVPQKRTSKSKEESSNFIIILASRMISPYYAFLVQCIEDEARKNGLHIISGSTYHSLELEKEYLNLAVKMKAIAVIYLFPPDNKAAIETIVGQIPIISICDNMPDSQVDQVELNNLRAGRIAAEHLIELGHKKIALFTPQISLSVVRTDRVQGVKKAIAEETNSSLQIYTTSVEQSYGEMSNNYDYDLGYSLAKKTEFLNSNATAIIAINDMLAMGAMDSLIEQGFRIPEDYSIVGFDNLIYSSLSRVSLTTVDSHPDILAQSAIDVLRHRLNLSPTNSLIKSARFKTECQPRLIVRKSTAKPSH